MSLRASVELRGLGRQREIPGQLRNGDSELTVDITAGH